MTMLKTLLLDRDAWDLVIDASGNIAMAGPPYAVAQDVATGVRTFRGELWYNTPRGIPYWDRILGKFPPLALYAGYCEAMARTVPGVRTAKCLLGLKDRVISGEIRLIDEEGKKHVINI